MSLCACSSSVFNTGRPSDEKATKQAAKFFLVYLFQEDGTRNKITASEINSGIDDTYVDGKIENTDPFQRWYPIGEFLNQEDTREDPTTEDFNDGTAPIVREGIRSFTGHLVDYGTPYLERLNYWQCKRVGVFEVDDCGNLNGKVDKSSGDLHPIPVQNGTWYARYMKGTNEAKPKISLQFQVGKLMSDNDLRTISANTNISADLLAKTGLIQLEATEEVAPTTTAFEISLDVDYGQEWGQDPASGFVAGDFTVYNITTSSTVTPNSVTEAPDGYYTFDLPAQNSGDELRVSLLANGKVLEDFDLTAIP